LAPYIASPREKKKKLYSTKNAGSVLSGVQKHYQTYANSLGTSTMTITDVATELRSSWVRSTVNTPGYNRNMHGKDFIKPRALPMNPFGFSKTRLTGRMGTRTTTQVNRVTGAWNETSEYGDWGSNTSLPSKDPAVFAELKAKTLNKLLKKVQDQSVNLGWAIAEGRQTVNMFVDNARRISQAARKFKQGNLAGAAQIFSGAVPLRLTDTGHNMNQYAKSEKAFKRDLRKNAPKALADRWLELQYGWKPLLDDIYGSLEFLANKLHKTPSLRESSGSRRTDVFKPQPYESADLRIDTTQTADYGVSYVLYFSQSGNHDLSSLGIANPASIAWEVVPWSFVVDWALPIGTYLNNLDAFIGLEFEKGCYTEFWKGSVLTRESGKQRNFGDWNYVTTSSVKEFAEQVSCSRNVLTSFPSAPLPDFKNPFKGGMTGPHALNAYALLTQAFSRKSP